MHTNITLPNWLDQLIFDEFNAVYNPQPQVVVYNPDLDYEFVKTYLGTYFPRSFAEAYCIVGNLLNNPTYNKALQDIEQINIFDFGCGTGGELFGVIYILQQNLPNLKTIIIDAMDANVEAIRLLFHLSEKIRDIKEIRIEVKVRLWPLFIQSDLEIEDLKNMINANYHFILSFKAINEFIQSNTFPNENCYKKIASEFLPLLSRNGVFILSDVTTPLNNSSTYYPQVLNRGINELIRKSTLYKSIVPQSCYYHENTCTSCYMQDVFSVTHSKRKNDISKVAYRIICRTDFANEIMRSTNSKNFCRATNIAADKNSPYV